MLKIDAPFLAVWIFDFGAFFDYFRKKNMVFLYTMIQFTFQNKFYLHIEMFKCVKGSLKTIFWKLQVPVQVI